MIKRFLCALLSVILSLTLVCCDKPDEKAQLLSFSQAQSISEMEKMDGKTVTIIGYMSTLSPVSGKFIYLMNLPYQSCPFCLPNTSTLSNTIAVYAKNEFDFTDSAIRITGTLEFGDFSDEFGYRYSYRIVNAQYEELDMSELSETLRLWQQLAASDVIASVYEMFEYVNFLCHWTSYYTTFNSGEDYLYPTDALSLIESSGARYNYGFKDGYFDTIIASVKDVDPNAFSELVSIIEDAKALSSTAYSELKNGKYTMTSEYDGRYNDGRRQYKMNSADELQGEMDTLYSAFSTWLAQWEI